MIFKKCIIDHKDMRMMTTNYSSFFFKNMLNMTHCFIQETFWHEENWQFLTSLAIYCVPYLPVRMWSWQQELEFHHGHISIQFSVLQTVHFIGNIRPSYIHLWYYNDINLIHQGQTFKWIYSGGGGGSVSQFKKKNYHFKENWHF